MRNVLLLIAICVLAIAAIFLMGPAEADTIIVDDDWSGADYSTISAAIAAADPGDTIRVYAGTYNEDNTVDKAINLVGNGTSTIIYGYKKDHTFAFQLAHGGCQVSGFYFYKWWPTHHYGAIGVFSDDNSIFDNTFYDNGRGIFFGNGRNNEILNNTFDDSYYHILVRDGIDEVRIAHNSFTKQYSSGILIQNSRGVEIFSNTFYNHTRCALTVSECSDVSVSFNMFLACDDTSERRFGASLHLSSDVNVDNNTFIGHGRAVFAWGTTDVRIEHNTILNGEEGLYFSRTWVDRVQTGPWCNGTIVRNNNIMGQSRLGANATYGQVTSIDARYNWWASASGPYHNSTNTAGLGVAVTDLITYAPYLSSMVSDMPPVAIIHKITPNITNEGEPVTFMGRGLARNVTTEHVWTSSIDGEIYRGTDVVFTLSDLSPGTHTITLKVRDTYGKWSEVVSTRLVVNGIPEAEIVSISPPVVNDGEEVHFLGRGTDHENDIRYVVWESDIDGVLSNVLEFTTTSLSNGTHIITLRVVDGYDVWSDAAVGEVIVNGRPIAIIDSVEHPLVNEGEAVILRGAYIDHEDGIISFWWGSDIDGELSDQMLFHTSSLSNGTHTITYRVQDDFLVWSENATVTVTINGLPRVTIVSVGPELPTTGEAVRFEGAWTDHEGTILAFEWTSDIDGPLSTHEDFETTRLSPGVHTIIFRAMDGRRVWSERAWTSVTVNGPPTAWIEPSDASWVNRGDTYHLVGGFSDPEGDIRGYEWVSNVDGVIGTAWNLTTSSLSNGSHTISFRVMDGLGVWSGWADVEVTVNGLPEAVIVEITPSSALEGDDIELIGSYVDHEGDAFDVEWSSDRDGFLSHEMGFTTFDLSNGSHVITLRVMDGYGVWSEPVTGKVHVNGRPRGWIETAEPLKVNKGERVHFAGAGADDLSVVAYLWSSSIDGVLSDISVFSTRDLSPGTHEISFSVQDDQGVWSEPAFVIVEVSTQVESAKVAWIEVPFMAFEGTEVVIECVIENDGDLPLLGLVVTVEMGEHLVVVHSLGEPLHPGERTNLEVTWVAELGIHIAFVSLVHDGILLDSTSSDDLMMVEPLPDPYQNEDPDDPGPKGGPHVIDGDNVSEMTFLLMAITTFIAVTCMAFLRLRRSD